MTQLELGLMHATPGARRALEESGQTPFEFLERHAAGDWGEISAGDQAENELSLQEGFRVISAYRLRTGVEIFVITEADRRYTTILLPEEY